MMPQHLCLSSHCEHLNRWQQAFPEGRIRSALEALADIPSATLIWLHAAGSHSPGSDKIGIDESIRTVTEYLPGSRIVVLSNTPSQREAFLALQSGAAGYCHAQATPVMLQRVATVVNNGGFWIGADVMNRILGATRQSHHLDPHHPALDRLTPREREVALAAGRGISNKELAQQFKITERTIKAHLGAIFEKLGVRDRLQLVVLLAREGAPKTGATRSADKGLWAGDSTARF